MLAPLALFLIAAPTAAQEDDSIAATVERLIERVNAYQAFHVVYDFDSSGEEGQRHATFELAYAAPDLGRMRMESDEATTEMWFTAEGVYARATPDGTWRRADRPPTPAAWELLEETFPAPGALEPGVTFTMALQPDEETGEVRFQLWVRQTIGDRTCPLSWLAALEAQPDEWALDDQGLLRETDGSRMRVSLEHGFPLRIEADAPGKHVAGRLRAIRLDGDCAAADLTLPAGAEQGLEDQGLARLQAAPFAPQQVRRSCFVRLQRGLDDGVLEWTALTGARWRALMELLHREVIEPKAAAQVQASEARFEAFAEQLRRERAADDSPAQRAAQRRRIEDDRAQLAEGLARAPGAYLEGLPPIESATLEFQERLYEAEAEVVRALHAELLIGPVLARFDALTQGLLDD